MSIILRVGAVKPLRTQDTQYGSGDEASGSYTDADVVDIPLPEHTYQRPMPAVLSQPQNNTSNFGLPYPDHNYGMLPPPSPPRPPTPDPPSPLQVNGVVQMEEEVKTSPMVSVVEEIVEDSITRCICGYLHDDGYMICCDKCSVWQHIDCMGVNRNDIPDNYFCELCEPRLLDAIKAKALQKLKREELAARNVLSDSSATDTDPEEPANAMASMVKKLPVTKKKGPKQKKNLKTKEKSNLKLKIGKVEMPKKLKKSGKKEKENIKAVKPKKLFKPGMRKLKEMKSRPLMVTDQFNSDPWDSNGSPWVDAYETIQENMYSDDIISVLRDTTRLFQSGDITTFSSNQLQAQLVGVAEVKKNRKGLKAVDNILAGQGIIEYTGRVMLKQEYDQQLFKAASALQPFVLFHSKGDIKFCVDASVSGNGSRFVRRSCTPNTEVQLQYRESRVHFVIEAKRDISCGVEVTIPFDYDYHLSATCIECACLRTNCSVSRFWKKKKKSQQKELSGKKKRQPSTERRKSVDHLQKVASPQGSPKKLQSPGRSSTEVRSPCSAPAQIHSPIRLSVSTLLAASALLEAQSEVPTDFSDGLNDSFQSNIAHAKTPTSPLPKSVTSNRRGSKASEEVKEEKVNSPTYHPAVTQKEKPSKPKETKHKVKENKEVIVQPPAEMKKERRLSTRRQSQEDTNDEDGSVKEEPNDLKDESCEEHYKKMTREERKLDAIMKAFEKMEKREERRKEAIARGEGSSKKIVEHKIKKKEEGEDIDSHVKSMLQEGGSADDEVKVEVEDVPGKSPTSTTACDKEISMQPASSSQVWDSLGKDIKPVKEEPSSSVHKPVRRFGKRKRRRSRVHTAPPLTESVAPPQSVDDNSSSSSVSQLSPYIHPSPASAPVQSTPVVDAVEAEPEEFKFIKSKKHLFNEWSHRHEDENSNSKEEMFVECLPSPRVNAMDHLQRRNSHSAGCNKTSESSGGGGFAKKRWLRQAMHEEPTPVPVPVPFNNSLSISTENGNASPINGSISPNNSVFLQSPGASSPLDFVTPLKKRRLMRESLSIDSNGSVQSPVPSVVSEPVTAVDVVASKTNGFKSLIPSHRLSVDDVRE